MLAAGQPSTGEQQLTPSHTLDFGLEEEEKGEKRAHKSTSANAAELNCPFIAKQTGYIQLLANA